MQKRVELNDGMQYAIISEFITFGRIGKRVRLPLTFVLFRVITDTLPSLVSINPIETAEDEFAVDRPHMSSSFRIHESFASVGSFPTWASP